MNAREALTGSVALCLVDDVSQVVQRAPFIATYPRHLWTEGLISELAEAASILNAKVADLDGAQGAGR